MSSSDGTGAARRAVAEEPQKASSAAGEDEDGLADPWFAPGPKVAAPESDPARAADSSGQAEWFLPTGRAGLLPDSMTESWDDDNGVARADRAERTEAAGAPPWGRDGASAGAGEPPPWETGPWPGPGEAAARRSPVIAADRRAVEPAGGDPERSGERRQRSRLIMAGGGAAILVLIVATVVIVTTSSGSPAAGCATYPAPVRQAYARAMSDLSGRAPASQQAADLERAATVANASAAAAGQITARNALFAMASDLDEAYSDVSKHRPVTPDLQQRLMTDGTALPRSCPG
jgi:hypothetical protein